MPFSTTKFYEILCSGLGEFALIDRFSTIFNISQ